MRKTNRIISQKETIVNGLQNVFRFDNNYGASVVWGSEFYYVDDDNPYELAVIKFNDDSNKYSLTYYTPITDDVLGHLTSKDVDHILNEIESLPTYQGEDK